MLFEVNPKRQFRDEFDVMGQMCRSGVRIGNWLIMEVLLFELDLESIQLYFQTKCTCDNTIKSHR